MRRTSAICASLIALASVPSYAGVITQTQSFDLSTTITVGGSSVGLLWFDRFDRSLGVLDSVDVTMSGSIELALTFPQNLISLGLGGVVPVPYRFSVTVTQSMPPMDFLNVPAVQWFGEAPGVGATLVGGYDYSHEFSLTPTSDLLGSASVTTTDNPTTIFTGGVAVALATPPESVSAERDGFAADFPGIPWILTPLVIATASPPSTASGGVVTGSLASSGSVSLTYNYTESLSAVPEPTTLTLVALGLAAMGWRPRRWERHPGESASVE